MDGDFDNDLVESFKDDLDLDECLEVVECSFAELEASDALSGRDWDLLNAFTQHSTGENKTCRLKQA